MLAAEDFSSGLRTLAKLAVNLFNNNEEVSALDLVGNLDDENFTLALSAIKLRKYGIDTDYTETEEKLYM